MVSRVDGYNGNPNTSISWNIVECRQQLNSKWIIAFLLNFDDSNATKSKKYQKDKTQEIGM
jgi:hypothetical protein